MTRVAVMGAGAVGCYYGGLLALAGHEVVLIGRPALVQAVTARGLLLERGGQVQAVPLAARADAAAVAGAELVLVCVKSGDTAAAARQMAPHLAPGAAVVSMQNGVGNEDRLSAVLGRPVVPAVVYVATGMAAPGHVRHFGRGELIFGQAPGAEAAAAVLRGAGVTVEVSAEARVAQWTKFAINCAFNAMSAISGLPYGAITALPASWQVMRDTLDEVQAVAAAEGVALPATLWSMLEGVAAGMPGQISSTAQDLQRGKPSEIDFLNGEVVRRAALHGLQTPVNHALWVLVKLAEARAATAPVP